MAIKHYLRGTLMTTNEDVDVYLWEEMSMLVTHAIPKKEIMLWPVKNTHG
jgi:hypothetical protein